MNNNNKDHQLTFQEIIAAVKKLRPDSAKLKFRAYDTVNANLQIRRLVDTSTLVQNIGSQHITIVESIPCADKESVIKYHNQWVAEGYEGAMIRLFNGTYGQGQRSSHLLKVKEFDSTEYCFENFEKGQRDEDLIAVCSVIHGEEFRAKMIGTAKHKEELYNAWRTTYEIVEGQPITIKHFGLTDAGLPRFPVGVGFRNYE